MRINSRNGGNQSALRVICLDGSAGSRNHKLGTKTKVDYSTGPQSDKATSLGIYIIDMVLYNSCENC